MIDETTAGQAGHDRGITMPGTKHMGRLTTIEIDPARLDSRAGDALRAGAIGDAWGYAVEFMSMAAILNEHGPAGLTAPIPDPDGRLIVSDDTQMTLFVLEGMLAAARDPDKSVDAVLGHLWASSLDWYGTQAVETDRRPVGQLAGVAVLQEPRAPGFTCMGALRNGRPGTIAAPVNDSKGCGGAMRIAPIAFLIADPSVALRVAAAHAAATHGHPEGWASAGILAGLLNRLHAGQDMVPAVRGAILDLVACTAELSAHRRPNSNPYWSAVQYAADHGRKFPTELGAGWTGDEAVAIGIWAALAGESVRDAIQLAVNHGGDSDSTGAIAGQIRAAWKPDDSLPRDWIDALDVADIFSQMMP